ncbi:MAG: substrate-binding domain-containing protein [Acidimicrobiales bacterium]
MTKRRQLSVFAATILAATTLAVGITAGFANATQKRGDVDVLYAGSLLRLMETRFGPAFDKASRYRFVGFAAGSTELANEVKASVRTGDVFVSASPTADLALEGKANGAWVSWYASFASSPLVLGYDPHGRFASALRSRPWYDVVTKAGFHVGRTDPTLDPKGVLTVTAIRETAQKTGDRKLLSILKTDSGVFPEETLLGRLEAGQLDAGFFYLDEARAAGIPTISLAPVALSATYTVTVLTRAPHEQAAIAFVRYLLGHSGRSILIAGGLDPRTPAIVRGTHVPSALAGLVTRG